MSKITEYRDTVQAAIDRTNTSLDAITADIAVLNQKIVDLNAGPESDEAWASIVESSAALATKAQGIDEVTLPPVVEPPIEPPVEPQARR